MLDYYPNFGDERDRSNTMLDHEAYKDESPLPESERQFLQYIRSNKKLGIRRADMSWNIH